LGGSGLFGGVGATSYFETRLRRSSA
jgi:hypothetical protein